MGAHRSRKPGTTKQEHDSQRLSRKDAKAANASLATVNRYGLEWIVEHSKTSPDQIIVCKAFLEQGQCSMKVLGESTTEKDEFHSTYTAFKSLPKYWMAEFTVPGLGFETAWVDLLDAGAARQIRQVLCYFSRINDATDWPKPLLRKALLTDSLMWRHSSRKQAQGLPEVRGRQWGSQQARDKTLQIHLVRDKYAEDGRYRACIGEGHHNGRLASHRGVGYR